MGLGDSWAALPGDRTAVCAGPGAVARARGVRSSPCPGWHTAPTPVGQIPSCVRAGWASRGEGLGAMCAALRVSPAGRREAGSHSGGACVRGPEPQACRTCVQGTRVCARARVRARVRVQRPGRGCMCRGGGRGGRGAVAAAPALPARRCAARSWRERSARISRALAAQPGPHPAPRAEVSPAPAPVSPPCPRAGVGVAAARAQQSARRARPSPPWPPR